MQSRQPSAYFHRGVQARRVRNLALDAALFVYLGLCCVFIGACVVGFYKLMQPIVYPNLRAAAYSSTALPAAQFDTERSAETSSAAERASGGEAALAGAIEPEERPGGGATPNPSKAKKSEAATLSSDTKRKPPARSKRHDPMMDYAAQPAFGNYRPWGNQNWGNQTWGNQTWRNQNWSGYRPSGNYQAPGGYRPWSYQGGGFRNGH